MGCALATPLAGVRRLFTTYRHLLAGRAPIPGDGPPEDPTALSYLVAAAMVLGVADKQRPLEAPGARARLGEERRLLRRETALVGALRALPAVDLARSPACPH